MGTEGSQEADERAGGVETAWLCLTRGYVWGGGGGAPGSREALKLRLKATNSREFVIERPEGAKPCEDQ